MGFQMCASLQYVNCVYVVCVLPSILANDVARNGIVYIYQKTRQVEPIRNNIRYGEIQIQRTKETTNRRKKSETMRVSVCRMLACFICWRWTLAPKAQTDVLAQMCEFVCAFVFVILYSRFCRFVDFNARLQISSHTAKLTFS